jgi:hypothetical protein
MSWITANPKEDCSQPIAVWRVNTFPDTVPHDDFQTNLNPVHLEVTIGGWCQVWQGDGSSHFLKLLVFISPLQAQYLFIVRKFIYGNRNYQAPHSTLLPLITMLVSIYISYFTFVCLRRQELSQQKKVCKSLKNMDLLRISQG